jgi:GNAT superfamily N-acetyltransferase
MKRIRAKQASPTAVTICQYDGINNTPAPALIAQAWTEMLTAGTVSNETVSSWDNQALVAFYGEAPAGLLTYDHVKYRKLVWIQLAWVAPAFRRLGIYRKLWDRVVIEARRLEAVKIQGGTALNNTVMREAARKMGRAELYVVTNFDL